MKVSSVKNYNQSFGYNKSLDKELNARLKTYEDQDWAKSLSSLKRSCNLLEDKLEKTQNIEDSKFKEYLDIFRNQKNLLAGYLAITFENLFFADKEYDTYQDEFVKHGSKPDDWRIGACDALHEWCECPHENKIGNYLLTDENETETIYVYEGIGEDGEETVLTTNSPIKPEDIPFNQQEKKKLKKNSLLEEFKPKASSPCGFDDVAGMDKLKQDLSSTIVQVINDPSQAQFDYEDYGKEIPRAVLLYGPPGCGKTYITEALSSEINTPLYMFSISKAGSSFINATSKNIKDAFDEAISIAKKDDKPVLLFMDEIDSVAFDRNDKTWPEDIKQVSTLLQCMDNAEDSGVIILAATNKYNLLDPAVKRRFTQKTFVDVPDEKARQVLLRSVLSRFRKAEKLLEDEKAVEEIAKKLEGYSNDSICKISKQAGLNALYRDRADISVQDFDKAIEETTEEKPDRKLYISDETAKKSKGTLGFTPKTN